MRSSLPNAYPVLKQAKPKLSTLSKSEILAGTPYFTLDVIKLLTAIIAM